jgi:hypothetical protein
MGNVVKSATTVSNGTIKRNNFLIGTNTSLEIVSVEIMVTGYMLV